MTKKELAQKVKTILQTVAGIIILGCVGATWQYFNQPTIEEVIDELQASAKFRDGAMEAASQKHMTSATANDLNFDTYICHYIIPLKNNTGLHTI